MKTQTQKVSMAEKIGYSLGDGSANLIFQMMMMFQLFFYTDVFGIKATAAGMILLVARIFDAFVLWHYRPACQCNQMIQNSLRNNGMLR